MLIIVITTASNKKITTMMIIWWPRYGQIILSKDPFNEVKPTLYVHTVSCPYRHFLRMDNLWLVVRQFSWLKLYRKFPFRMGFPREQERKRTKKTPKRSEKKSSIFIRKTSTHNKSRPDLFIHANKMDAHIPQLIFQC